MKRARYSLKRRYGHAARKLTAKEWRIGPFLPSDRHVWKTLSVEASGNHTARCERCGAYFNAFADTRGPIWCNPTPAWLRAHPEDDGAGRGDEFRHWPHRRAS